MAHSLSREVASGLAQFMFGKRASTVRYLTSTCDRRSRELVEMGVAVEESESRPVGEAARPPRLNCAGLCLRCGKRDCDAPKCIAWHEASYWAVCPRCDGEEWSELL